ncbi:MAG: hypothetical protein U0L49_00495 [Eubacterium sp.]|nr:hypothetical protein [Eubacterium sp.]
MKRFIAFCLLLVIMICSPFKVTEAAAKSIDDAEYISYSVKNSILKSGQEKVYFPRKQSGFEVKKDEVVIVSMTLSEPHRLCFKLDEDYIFDNSQAIETTDGSPVVQLTCGKDGRTKVHIRNESSETITLNGSIKIKK